MKKLYSLIAVVGVMAAVNAQGTENLNSQSTTSGTNYQSVSFNGQNGTSWAFTTTRIIDTEANYNIEGVSAILQANGTVTATFPNGIGNLKFDYRKAFTGGTARSIQVSVDGAIVNTTAQFGSGSGAQPTVYNFSYDINKTSSTVVEIKVLGAQTTLDNFVWTAPEVLAVGNVNADKKVLVKNTVVSDMLLFGTKADVQIISANGQVVKTAKVENGTELNVSSLAKGLYIVSGVANGEKFSQKIIKK